MRQSSESRCPELPEEQPSERRRRRQEDYAMKRHRIALISAAALAALTISCAPHARVGVYADVPGPPALAFETEPYLVPLPGTYAYGVPDYDVDL